MTHPERIEALLAPAVNRSPARSGPFVVCAFCCRIDQPPAPAQELHAAGWRAVQELVEASASPTGADPAPASVLLMAVRNPGIFRLACPRCAPAHKEE